MWGGFALSEVSLKEEEPAVAAWAAFSSSAPSNTLSHILCASPNAVSPEEHTFPALLPPGVLELIVRLRTRQSKSLAKPWAAVCL